MIVVESKRKKAETIAREYPDAVVIDVTSKSANGEYVKFSPFYPHCGIPVPGMPGVTAASVEGIWQGLKTFEGEGISCETMNNRSMKNLKRTVRTHGRCLGHKYEDRLLGYIEARKLIYVPTYDWVLQNRMQALVEKIRDLSSRCTVVLLDYETNADVNDASKPLSHASLIKAYVDSMPSAPVQAEVEYSEGMKVRHAKFGEGTVMSYDADSQRVVVSFAEGEKTLSTRLAKLDFA